MRPFTVNVQVVIPDRFGTNRGGVIISENPHPYQGTTYTVMFHATGIRRDYTADQMRVLKRRRHGDG